jgi:DDE_Tnp_1-associated
MESGRPSPPGQGLSILGQWWHAVPMDTAEMGRSLVAALATVPDPRSAQGRRHPLAAVLALSVAAMLSGARSLYAIAQWGRCQPEEVRTALGFTHAPTPAVSTLHLVFKQLDARTVEAALAAWAAGVLGGAAASVAVDGKALRGTYREALPGLEVVAAYATEAGLVLAQAGGEGHGP